MARQRDYQKEYQQRQAKARREGFKSYGAKRWSFGKRSRLISKAVRKYTQKFGTLANPGRVRANMGTLTNAELKDVISASLAQLKRWGRLPPVETPDSKQFNPYWYH